MDGIEVVIAFKIAGSRASRQPHVIYPFGIGMFFGFGLAGARYAQIFPDPNSAPPTPPSGAIAHIQHFLNYAVTDFTTLIHSLTSPFLSSFSNPWTQFWLLPCLIATVVFFLFIATFWDKSPPKDPANEPL